MQKLDRPQHRPDIQGLRALAVLAVLLFHVGSWADSGYLGVDVFFVISGYVISMAYLDKFLAKPGLSSVVDFFLRRFCRLAPALVTVVALTMLAVLVLLPPTESKLMALKAGSEALLQTSNLFFRSTGTNYWLDNLDRNPFLHTWSLSAEWQFYAAFPAVLLPLGFLYRQSPYFWPLAIVCLIAVVTGSLWLFATADSKVSFYGPLSRFWQFGLGIAAFVFRGSLPALSSAASSVLVGLIAGSFLLPQAVVPQVVGSIIVSVACALLLANPLPQEGPVSGTLLSRPLQAIGHASYSIYLVHWPICVLGRLLLSSGAAYDGLLLTLSIVAGFFLTATIEYRLKDAGNSWKASLACLAFISVVVAAERKKVLLESPWYGSPPLVAEVDGYHNYWWTEVTGVRTSFMHAAQFQANGLYRKRVSGVDVHEAVAVLGSGRTWIVGIGNSYIQSAGLLLSMYAARENHNLMIFHIANCARESETRCRRSFEHVAAVLRAGSRDIREVYVAFRDLDAPDSVPARLLPGLLDGIKSENVRLILQGPSPNYPFDPQTCLSTVRPCSPDLTFATDIGKLESAESRLTRLLPQNMKPTIWSPYRSLCHAGMCFARRNGRNLVMDTDHLSNAGQVFLYEDFSRHLHKNR